MFPYIVSNYNSSDLINEAPSPLVRPWRDSLKEYIEMEWRTSHGGAVL